MPNNQTPRSTHLLRPAHTGDTVCGIYWPNTIFEMGFGTYQHEEVTCKKCLAWLQRKTTQESLR